MERLNYHHLYYFWLVAKLGSFTKASQQLRIAQSAVSSQVAQLEDHLGTPLLKRLKSRAIELTEEGRMAFDQAEEIFRQGRELTESLKHAADVRVLRVGATGNMSRNLQVRLLQPILKNRNVQLEVVVGDMDTLLGRLAKYQIDALICDFPYKGSEDEPLLQMPFAEEDICLVGQKMQTPMSLSHRLEKEGVYLPSKSSPTCLAAETYLKREYPKVFIRGYIDDIALMRLLALETTATVVIPRVGVQRELQSKSLRVLSALAAQKEKFYLIARRRGARTKKLLELFELE